MARRWRGGGLGRSLLVRTADLDGDGAAEIVALAGPELKVFDWTGDTYQLRWEAELGREGLSLAAGSLTPEGVGAVAVGTRDGVLLYGLSSGGLALLCQTLLFPGAYFRSVDLADVDGDGRTEVVAAGSGAQTLYVFQIRTAGGEARLEELGRVYTGGLVTAQGTPDGQVVAGTRDGYVDVFVPCSLLPGPAQAIYSVRRGDSLWRIARKFGVSPGSLARANRLTEPYQLEPGQILVIPPPAGPARSGTRESGEGRPPPARGPGGSTPGGSPPPTGR
ncbi:MAG: LysM peptidoglycan-binding domain-containing protein [Firmicutes bacterium]|nr:LysM peptidoglycan-binding domain-containing protein [Bacillota bacterium]